MARLAIRILRCAPSSTIYCNDVYCNGARLHGTTAGGLRKALFGSALLSMALAHAGWVAGISVVLVVVAWMARAAA